jgi:hypothetical protein
MNVRSPSLGITVLAVACGASVSTTQQAPPSAAPSTAAVASSAVRATDVAGPPTADLAASPMAPAEAKAVAAALVGRWTLTRHVVLRPEVVERPIRPRAPTERAAEQWTFHADGRFEHAIDDFASAGRWRVAGRWPASPPQTEIVPSGWIVLALDDVALAALPDRPPRQAWALAAVDDDSRLLVWLGERLVPEAADLAGRFVTGP